MMSSKMVLDVRTLFRKFAEYTTFHGVNRIISSKLLTGRVLWLCIVLTSFCMCIRQIYILSVQFSSYKITTKVSIFDTDLYFPSISFCDLNPLSHGKIKENKDKVNLAKHLMAVIKRNHDAIEGLKNGTIDIRNTSFNTDDLQSEALEQEFRREMNHFHTNITRKEVRLLSPSFKEFVLSCKYDGDTCNESSFVPFYDPYYGQCYRFSKRPLVAKHVGHLFAFQLFLNVNQSDYIPYVSDDPGVVLSIHENGYRPFLQSNGFLISPGFKTDISLVQRRKERNRAVFGSNDLCDDSGKFRNLQACFEVCKETVIEKNCNCSPTLSDIHLGLGLCENITELQCMTEAVKGIDSCGCKEPCSEIQYKTFRSFTIWPGRSYVGVLEALLKERGLAYQDLRESLLFINIYFTSLQEEITEEELAYTVENFWSDIGGSLGLWVGMSVISLAEILELGILILRFFRKRTFRLHTKELKRANAEAKLNDGLNQIIKGFNDIHEDKPGGRIEFHDGLSKIINSINILAAEQQKSENDQNAIEISIIENERVQPEQNNVYARQEFIVE